MVSARKSLSALRENPLLLAAIVSLAIHLAIFGGWKLNQRYGWVKNNSMPAWLQKMTEKVAPKKILSSQLREVPLIFVDVDPQSSVKESPKDAKFYGAANSKAASAKKLDSELPEIKGKQDKIIKTTENSTSKAQPLQPSPAPPAENDTQESKPKQKEVVGDLALAKPQEQNKKLEGESEAEKKAHSRPRRVEDVKPGLRGAKMSQQGGANHLALEPAFNVKVTSFGDYDREFIAAVQQCWYDLLEGRNTVPGKVVVEFRLNYDGRITDLKVAENTTHNPMLELICKGAIDKPSPYRKWPTEMRRELKSDTRDVRFTFYYE
jgi:outer membrane biosynthesis protein TonB